MKLPSLSNLVTSGVTGIINAAGDQTDKIIKDFKADPNKVLDIDLQIKQVNEKAIADAQNFVTSMESQFANEMESVNKTMREEAKSEHWLQWSWRPIIGFTFCAIIINNYIIVPYLKNYGILPVEVPSLVWESILAIEGVNSIGRSAVKWMNKKKEKNG